MKNIFLKLSLGFGILTNGFAVESLIEEYNWGGVDVVWLKDESAPTYDFQIYFADGGLHDHQAKKFGVTQAMFNLLNTGTTTRSLKDIDQFLDFNAISFGSNITHESSILSMSGLTKNIGELSELVCDMFSNAQFPETELKKYIEMNQESLDSLVMSKSAMAQRAFRELSLSETPYAYPVAGKKSDFSKLTSVDLKENLKYFNNSVYKKIYLAGPESILKIKDIIINKCPWSKEQNKFKRTDIFTKKFKNSLPQIYLVTVPDANQAQVLFGKYLNKLELSSPELLNMSSGFLGGGFTSKLMQEVRVKRGLTYGIGAMAAGQKNYGRSYISTSTKNQSVPELINVVKNVLQESSRNINQDHFNRSQSNLSGGFPFTIETKSEFLNQVVQYDHTARDYKTIGGFPERIRKIKKSEVEKTISSIYKWSDLTIVVLGSKDLEKSLKKFGKLKVVDYKIFL